MKKRLLSMLLVLAMALPMYSVAEEVSDSEVPSDEIEQVEEVSDLPEDIAEAPLDDHIEDVSDIPDAEPVIDAVVEDDQSEAAEESEASEAAQQSVMVAGLEDAVVRENGTAIFKVKYSCSGAVAFQWQKIDAAMTVDKTAEEYEAEWQDIVGENDSKLVINVDGCSADELSSELYRCVLTDEEGNSYTSNEAKVVIEESATQTRLQILADLYGVSGEACLQMLDLSEEELNALSDDEFAAYTEVCGLVENSTSTVLTYANGQTSITLPSGATSKTGSNGNKYYVWYSGSTPLLMVSIYNYQLISFNDKKELIKSYFGDSSYEVMSKNKVSIIYRSGTTSSSNYVDLYLYDVVGRTICIQAIRSSATSGSTLLSSILNSVTVRYASTCGENLNWNLDIYNGVLTITGSGAMDNYTYSDRPSWDSYESYIKTVSVSNGPTSIGEYAFCGCSSLTSITISNSVTSIGGYAFEGCYSLTSISIPDSIASIGGYAFWGCSSLTSITLPDGITSIGSSAFYHCTSLSSITIPDSVTSIGSSAFQGCTALTSISIPDSETSIGYSAFRGCTGLTSISIPASVTSIGSYAFEDCESLNNVYYGGTYDSWTKISFTNVTSYPCSEAIYFNGEQLTEVEIPNGTTRIDAYAYTGIGNLKSITIPASVTNIGKYAFYNCTGLENIYYDGTLDDWVSITCGNEYSRPTYYAKNLYCKGELKTGITVTIPDGVTSIEAGIYNGLGYIESIIIPESVTSIEAGAFRGCCGLKNIEIPDSVTTIGSSAFRDCTALTCITVPDSVTNIGKSAFAGCTNLKDMTLPFVGGSENENTYIGYLFGADGYYSNRKYVPHSLKNIIITGGTDISQDAFYECSSLTSVTIPNSVTSIGENAFYGCNSLIDLTLPFVGSSENKNTYLGYLFGAFSYKYNKSCVPQSLKNIIVTGGTSIGATAFYNCSSLTSITIPDSTTSIGYCAFMGCSSLTNIIIPNSVTSIAGCAFYDCSSLTSITIPDRVTSIAGSTFYDCSSLTSITIPNSVTSIANCAFYGCTSLTSITIPDSVTYIDKGAFYDVPIRSLLDINAEFSMGVKEQVTIGKYNTALNLKFKISNTKVISVNAATGIITGKKSGTATISVQSASLDYNLNQNYVWIPLCTIHVGATPSKVSLPSVIELYEGQETDFVPTITGTSYHLNWTIGDERVVQFSNGKLAALGTAGATTTLKVTTFNNKSSNEATVTIKEKPTDLQISAHYTTLGYSQKVQIDSAITAPNGDPCTVLGYASSDTSIVTVSASGLVTAAKKKSGTATVTVTTSSGIERTIDFTVVPAPSKVTLNSTKATLGVGESFELTAAFTAGTATDMTCTSSKTTIASAEKTADDKWIVTAYKAGTAKLTVKTHNGKSAVLTVTVKAAPAAITLSSDAVILGVAETAALTATITKNSSSAISWSSSDPCVTVTNGQLTANSVGTATVTANTYNGLVAVCTVTVKEAPTALKLDSEAMTLSVGMTQTLGYAFGSNTETGTITYTTSNAKVATVDSTGKITAKKAGTATITAKTYNDKTSTCVVTVVAAPTAVALNAKTATLNVGETFTLIATPNHEPTTLRYTSSNSSVASVDENGVITANLAGTAKITVYTHNNKKAVCTITVK